MSNVRDPGMPSGFDNKVNLGWGIKFTELKEGVLKEILCILVWVDFGVVSTEDIASVVS